MNTDLAEAADEWMNNRLILFLHKKIQIIPAPVNIIRIFVVLI